MRFFHSQSLAKFNVIHVTHLSNNLTISSSWIDSGKFPTQRCRLSLTISKVLYPPGSCGCCHDPFTNSLSGSQMVCDEPWICKELCEKKCFSANETTKCTEYTVGMQEKFIERQRVAWKTMELVLDKPRPACWAMPNVCGYGLAHFKYSSFLIGLLFNSFKMIPANCGQQINQSTAASLDGYHMFT